MKQSIIITLASTITLAIAGNVLAGNTPNSARTLTNGIGSGTTHGRIPGSLPYNTSRATKRSSKASSVLESVSLDRYRSGVTNRPASAGGAATAAGSRPASFPGAGHWSENAQQHAGDRVPDFGTIGSGSIASGNSHAPSVVNTGVPASVSLPGNIPSSVSIPGGTVTPGSRPTPPVASSGMPAAPDLPAMPQIPAAADPGMAAASAGLERRGGGRL